VSEKSRNEMIQEMINRTIQKHVKFGCILADSWFTSKENMRFIEKKGKVFIFEMNGSRPAATSEQEREQGRFIRIDQMETLDGEPIPVYLESVHNVDTLWTDFLKKRICVCKCKVCPQSNRLCGQTLFKRFEVSGN
jgi:hypothetical protein